MPRRKPQGWPKLMVTRRLASGLTAYYWVPPTWAAKRGCNLRSEALGQDYGTAKARCDDVLNPQFDAWRLESALPVEANRVRVGTFDWLVTLYKSSPKYTGKPPQTRRSYDASLHLVSSFKLKDGRCFGTLAIGSITPGAADRLYAKLKLKADGTERVRTAILAMSIAKRAWNVARRDKPEIVPLDNPFAKMGLSYKAKATRPVTHDEVVRFVAAADAAGEPSIGTAAMIAFFWLQRQEDILSRLSWGHYRPADAPHIVRVFHHKTDELVEVPLFDTDGTALWPQIMDRLDAAPRRGTLIVIRDQPDRLRKVHLPWQFRYFRHRVAEIRSAAGIDPEVKFMGLRHGGNVEGAEAGLTDAQLRALSGHLTTAALLRYAQATPRQRQAGGRKRLDARTKKEGLSK
ncbi:hypothetical protein [Methylobacterium aerolatum]|uniref:Integrase n=1 Tax=Methylobacterium aerolatum TaxID=418708 RepID=A0ABU0HXC3_9HYPH|nr:hypothetical protein [Methylobacterium aerolatum]MDQ0446992.1 hypothetical protein [Methylobacterium aerolatum]GJD36781.1 hypothetical protein FMGBMHLM_3704 [Methylobacterium aerolatum]